MDCNMRSPLQWDWENLIMSDQSKTDDNHKVTEWEVEKGEGIESIVPSFTALERVGSGSTNSFCHTAVPKISQSTSVKHCKLASESSLGDSCSNMDFVQVKASTTLEVSVTSAESDLCLKLGKRRKNNDILTPSVVAGKRTKSCGQGIQIPRCQIDGCELDLSSAKDYHRKHRVCESHSKCPKVVVGGLERRFCQQCSRFHAVSEFDETKRSCRKRLSHHNERRRKPQGVFPLIPERVCNGKRNTNMLWNGLSLNTRSEGTYAWGTTDDTKPTQIERGFTLSFQRGHGSEEQLYASSSRSFSTFQTANGFSVGKANLQLPGKGVGEYSGVLHESQDYHRALSLLSTSSDPLVQPHAQPVSSLFFSYDVPK